jgi:hypothetical protein
VPILPCTDDQYDPVYDRLDAMEPVQEEPSEEPDNECQNCGAPGGYPWCSETCERVGQPPEELIPEPEPDVTDGITPESAERAAQQLLDMVRPDHHRDREHQRQPEPVPEHRGMVAMPTLVPVTGVVPAVVVGSMRPRVVLSRGRGVVADVVVIVDVALRRHRADLLYCTGVRYVKEWTIPPRGIGSSPSCEPIGDARFVH